MLYAKFEGVRYRASRDLVQREYQCPYKYCTNPAMNLKKGLKRRPHFAHKRQSNCEDFSEHETDAHIAMKEYLQEFLNIPEEYVEYGKIEGVRPDLVWQVAQVRFAIEVQHSTIPIEEVKRRNEKYFSNGFIPIWILHSQEMEGNNYYEEGIYLAGHFLEECRLCFSPAIRNNNPASFFRRKRPLVPCTRSFPEVPAVCEDYFIPIKGARGNSAISEEGNFTKLKDVEQYILQSQGTLCYIAFDNDYRTDEPLFGYEAFEKVEGKKTLYVAKSLLEKRNFMFHSAAEFEVWALDYPGGGRRKREEEEQKARLKAQEQKREESEARARALQERLKQDAISEAQRQEVILKAQKQKWEAEAKLRKKSKEDEQKARLREQQQEDERIDRIWLEVKGLKRTLYESKQLEKPDKLKQLRMDYFI